MDVNETLRELRELVSKTRTVGSDWEGLNIGLELAEKFEALDEWVSKGGFLPTDWLTERITRELTREG